MELKIVESWSLNDGRKLGKFSWLHEIGLCDVWESLGCRKDGLTQMHHSVLVVTMPWPWYTFK